VDRAGSVNGAETKFTGTINKISLDVRATLAGRVRERANASEPRERSAPTKRRARERVGESEGRSLSDE
jgi:hypothetical protein